MKKIKKPTFKQIIEAINFSGFRLVYNLKGRYEDYGFPFYYLITKDCLLEKNERIIK